MKVVPVAFEELMRLDAAGHDQIARSSSVHARLAEAGQAQLLAVANAHRNFHGNALSVGHAALAFAFRARMVDGLSRTAARTAGRGGLHVAQERVLYRDHAALAMAHAARDLLAALSQACAVAVRTGRQAVVDDLLLCAGGNLLERQTQADAHVATFFAHLRRPSGCTAEEGAEQVSHAAEPAAEQVFEVDVAARATACSARDGAEAVVLRALVRVRQNVVRFVELFEAVLGVGSLVHVRMKLACFFAERFLDFVVRRIAVDAKHFIEVVCHRRRLLLVLSGGPP